MINGDFAVEVSPVWPDDEQPATAAVVASRIASPLRILDFTQPPRFGPSHVPLGRDRGLQPVVAAGARVMRLGWRHRKRVPRHVSTPCRSTDRANGCGATHGTLETQGICATARS